MIDRSTQTVTRIALVSAAWCMCSTPSMSAQAAAMGQVVTSTVPGWPQWRGPRRDGISSERGLLQEWPEDGPKLLWSINGLGKGFASPCIVGDRIYIAGDHGDELVVFALDLAGQVQWRTANGKSWKKSHPGSRATCCYDDDGKLYVMNAHGRLACISAADGAEIWAVNVLKEFGAGNITWGISESVLVDGDAVFVTPVGKKALMAALDKRTGATLWTTEPLPEEQATYSSPILVELRGRRQLISCGTKHSFGVDAGSGTVLWKHAHAIPKWVVGASPIFHRDSVYVSNGTKDDGKVYRLVITGDEPKMAWAADIGNTHVGNVVCADGIVLGSRKWGSKGWLCVDVETGETRHADLDMHRGAAVYADGRFYCLTDRGSVSLRRLTDEGIEEVGRVEVIRGKRDVWGHPVICGGRLYVRYHDKLYCYDIRRTPGP